jgi:hypothetical protein
VLNSHTSRPCRLRWWRHPSPIRLGAWFDGEEAPEVADHLRGCERCRRRVHDLRRVRAAVRSEPVPVPLRRRRLAVGGAAVPAAAALAVVLGLAGATSLSDPIQAARRHLPSPLGLTPAGEPAAAPVGTRLPPDGAGSRPFEAGHSTAGSMTGPSAPDRASGTPTTGAAAPGGAHPASRPAPPAPTSTGPTPAASDPLRPLRLGAVLPDDDDAGEITRALQRAVEIANRSGGVGGRPVELSTAPAHDPGAVLALTRSVDALVGGAGPAIPAGTPWLFPADPALGGDGVVPAETSPVDVGIRLAEDLEARSIPGPVGAVVGDGPDAGLADGVASRRPTVRVPDDGDGTCQGPVSTLRRRAVSALVLAGPPGLVERCTRAAALLGWRPPGGILVPPSAAYAHLERNPAAQGARTVLGLPWPDSDTPGANRYRAAVPDGHSYRALISFAAVELAVQVARTNGTIRIEGIATGRWRSDLFDLEGSRHYQPPVVVASFGTWLPQPPGRPVGPAGDGGR